MNLFDSFLNHLDKQGQAPHLLQRLKDLQDRLYYYNSHGNWSKWMDILSKFPNVQPSLIDLDQDTLIIGRQQDLSETDWRTINPLASSVFPWRKGPYRLFDVTIDAEWRSDLKWNRIAPHLPSLEGKVILDIGCGNGYHLWKMQQAGASLTLGIDHTMVYFIQFLIFQKYIQSANTTLFPFPMQDFVDLAAWNDIIFSMGVLYHQKDPLSHLKDIHRMLKPNGYAVIETLYVETDQPQLLVPQDRYARMRNVHNIPSPVLLEEWLHTSGFSDIRCIDATTTTEEEQRTTTWMTGPSLKDFLDPDNPNLTVEGYPAPKRITYLVHKA